MGEKGAHVDDALGVLDHLDLRDVVRPSGVPEQRGDLAAQLEEPVHDRDVDLQTGLVAFIGTPAGLWVLSEFELKDSEVNLQGQGLAWVCLRWERCLGSCMSRRKAPCHRPYVWCSRR